MSVELFTDLKNIIDNAEHPVLAVIVSDGCEHYKGMFLTDLEDKISKQANPVHIHVICYPENHPVFPLPMTQIVYYFAPKNHTPLFHRIGSRAMAVVDDVKAALQMMKGSSYLEAAYTPEAKVQYEKTEQMMKTEDTSKFPSLFQQARNLAKEMWVTGKSAAQGLPVIVDAETAFNRFSICQGCEFLKENFRCEKCGCFMKAKTQLAPSSCPVGKWSAVKQ